MRATANIRETAMTVWNGDTKKQVLSQELNIMTMSKVTLCKYILRSEEWCT